MLVRFLTSHASRYWRKYRYFIFIADWVPVVHFFTVYPYFAQLDNFCKWLAKCSCRIFQYFSNCCTLTLRHRGTRNLAGLCKKSQNGHI